MKLFSRTVRGFSRFAKTFRQEKELNLGQKREREYSIYDVEDPSQGIFMYDIDALKLKEKEMLQKYPEAAAKIKEIVNEPFEQAKQKPELEPLERVKNPTFEEQSKIRRVLV